MTDGLTPEEVQGWLDTLTEAAERDTCPTCGCFQGMVAQLKMDAAEDVSTRIAAYEVPRAQMHGILGCESCGPGATFADYIRAQKSPECES